jgi:TPR repeat protein
MSIKLVRCVEGHVFDSSRHATCPVCGASALREENVAEEAPKNDGAAARERKGAILNPRIFFAVGGAVAVIYGTVRLTRPPVEPITACCSTPDPEVAKKDERAEPQFEPAERAASPSPVPPSDSKSADNSLPNPVDRQTEPPLGPPARAPAASASLEPAPGKERAQRQPDDRDVQTSKSQSSTNIFSELPAVSYPPTDVREVQRALGLSDAVVDVTQYFLTWRHFNEQHDKESLALIAILAKRAGIPHASFTLYQAYSQGYGVETNSVAAAYYLQQAAEKHFTLALVALGDRYLKGDGAPQDAEKAKSLFLDAARQDSPEGAEKFRQAGGDPRAIGRTASELLGMTRRLSKRTPELARKYMQDGMVGAEYALAFYEYRTSSGRPPREALELMEKAAFNNVAPAYMILGEIYENGIGVKTSPAEAVLWYGVGYEVTEDPTVRGQIGSKIEHAARKVDAFSKIQDFVPSLSRFSQSSLR